MMDGGELREKAGGRATKGNNVHVTSHHPPPHLHRVYLGSNILQQRVSTYERLYETDLRVVS